MHENRFSCIVGRYPRVYRSPPRRAREGQVKDARKLVVVLSQPG